MDNIYQITEMVYNTEMNMREKIVERLENIELPRAQAQRDEDNLIKLMNTISLKIHEWRTIQTIYDNPELIPADGNWLVCPLCNEEFEEGEILHKFKMWGVELCCHWGCNDDD